MDFNARRKLIRYSLLAIVVLIGLAILNWFYNTGTLVLNLQNISSDNAEIILTSHDSGESVTINKNTNPLSLRTRRGAYDVLVTSSSGSFFSITNVGGWLKKTEVTGELKPELGRQYVAKDVASCVQAVKSSYVSYGCGGPAKDIRLHLPGTETVPPIVFQDKLYALDGEIEGVLKTEDDTPLVLISSPAIEGAMPNHSLYSLVGSKNTIINRDPVRVVSELDPYKKYTALNYDGGFLVYDTSFGEVLFIQNFKDDPLTIRKLSVFGESEVKLPLTNVSVVGKNISALYSDVYDGSLKEHRSEVVIGNTESSMIFKFDKGYTSVQVCGENLLCLGGAEGIDVYEITGKDKVNFQYNIRDVRYMFKTSSKNVLVMDDRLVEFDTASKQGFTTYSFGESELQTISEAEGGHIVSMRDSSGSVSGILVSSSLDNDFIDRKIGKLNESPLVQSVSAFKNYIYISPEVGKPYFDTATKQVIYSPSRRKSVSKALPGVLSEIGIDTKRYKVINLLP